MRLVRVVNCVKLLNWETQLPHGTPVDPWLSRLRSRGATPLESGIPGLERLRLDNHTVLVVRRSGRVVMRLDYTTPHHQRRHAAERLFATVVDTVVRPDTAIH